MTKEELFILAQQGDELATEELIKLNYRLIWTLIQRKCRNCGEKEDLFALGLIGLWRAIETFNLEKNYQFSTYAMACINNEIYMEIRKPKFEASVSLEEKVYEDNSLKQLKDFIPDSFDMVEAYEKKEQAFIIDFLVSCLPKRDQDIIKLYFGFDGESYSMREIGQKYNITQQGISHIIRRVCRKLERELKYVKVGEIITLSRQKKS